MVALFQGEKFEDIGKSSREIFEEILPWIKDSCRQGNNFFIPSIFGWVFEWSTWTILWLATENTYSWIHRTYSIGGKIKLTNSEETIELIENMIASDHAILHDRTHVPTKRSLLELSSQDALLAQNKLLAKQLESLTKTLSKLPTQLQAAQPSHSTIMQVGGCCIYGGAHESGCCIPQDEAAKEVNYMGNQNRQGFHSSSFSSYQ